MNYLSFIFCGALVFFALSCQGQSDREIKPWTAEQAWQWYRAQPWLVGCNFTPSTAVNQLEMWQAETFDPGTIDRELGYAEKIGMNIVRVYLHDLAWTQDPSGFKARVDSFLSIADRHRIRALPVIFDDCWNDSPQPGRQPDPIPGVHNSGWVKSPGSTIVNDSTSWERRRITVISSRWFPVGPR